MGQSQSSDSVNNSERTALLATSPEPADMRDEPRLPTPAKPQSSLTTIFSVWNTMVGSALLTFPWGFTKSGLLMGVLTVLFMGVVTWYTMSLILRWGAGRRLDFIDVCNDYLGRPGRWCAWAGSILVTFGATVVYNILIATNAYALIAGIVEVAEDDSSFAQEWYWSNNTAPIIVGILLLPHVSLPTFRIAVKISGVGIAGMLYVLVTIFVLAGLEWDPHAQRDYVYQGHFYFLAGITSLSYFVHNFVLQVAATGHPKKVLRDVSIGFGMGGLTYTLIGAVVYSSLGRNVPQNMFDYFDVKHPLVIAGRVALLFQLCSVMPLLFGITRVQIFSAFMGTEKAQSLGLIWRFGFGFVLLVITTLLTILFPQVGDVTRFVGAGCGLFYLFILPISVHLVQTYRKEGRISIFSIIFHGALIVLGVLLLVSQFID